MLIKYKNLTDKQKDHLINVFYKREMVQPEKKYNYYFNDEDVCEYAE